MRISYTWLKDYIDYLPEPVETAEILTNVGLEVEGLEEIESVKGGLKGVVVGKVVNCRKHPDADKLSITQVDVGQDELLNIVCGAPNVAAGQKVAVALSGTTLYKGDESITLKKTKIRGEVSEGMICAEDELGLGENHLGIMVLDENAEIGMKAGEYFNLSSDYVFEIGLTPNRIDSASHYGVARDIAAFLNQSKKVNLKKPSVEGFKSDNNSKVFGISIENKEACVRYSGLTISGVSVKPSPDWLQNKLRAIGLKPINNIVDITNFVLHETGQPLHAFDADKVTGEKIIVKTLPEGSKFKTLDEAERNLSANDLMICNEKEGMCIAGVFGGIDSGVKDETKSIFLESACFNPVYIRKTSKLHLLNTDSSFRFERGSDPNVTVYALKRAAMLIKELAGGEITSDVVDVYPEKVEEFIIKLEPEYVNRLIGKDIPLNQVISILKSLDFKILEENKDHLLLSVPTYRVDVFRPADVVEEILRIYGYNQVETSHRLNSTLSFIHKPDVEKMTNLISDLLTARGFNEMMSNSLTKAAYYNTDDNENDLVKIFNPLSSDLNAMRKSMIYGGLEAVAYNINRKNPNLKLYEFGNVYSINTRNKSANNLDKYFEERHLVLFITGDKWQENWIRKTEKVDFYELKSYVYLVLNRLGMKPDAMDIKESASEYIDEGVGLFVRNKEIVSFGNVKKSLLQEFDIENPVYFADINWTMVIKNYDKKITEFKPIPRFPEVRRDLSMVLERKVQFEEIRSIAFRKESRFLKNVRIFDVYEGDKIEKGKKSYALSFILQDEDKTLTDKQIDKIMNNIAMALTEELGAQIRS